MLSKNKSAREGSRRAHKVETRIKAIAEWGREGKRGEKLCPLFAPSALSNGFATAGVSIATFHAHA
jgi:hypothetical protein